MTTDPCGEPVTAIAASFRGDALGVSMEIQPNSSFPRFPRGRALSVDRLNPSFVPPLSPKAKGRYFLGNRVS